jgi:threonine dehydrogenase-like Zn-dependent dehydrogenase
MRGTVLYGARDVRYEEVPEPKILKPTDAIIRLAATCVCGSDLWSYRGINRLVSHRVERKLVSLRSGRGEKTTSRGMR